MPVHDWTRVISGIFHDFHHAWVNEIRNALNGGLLPDGFYALAEQVAEGPRPDVLTLESSKGGGEFSDGSSGGAVLAVAEHPPRVKYTDEQEREIYAHAANRIAVYHASGDRVIAYVEIVSPGNKHSPLELEKFIEKLDEAVSRGCHLLIIDLHPPRRHDPRGIHAAFWEHRSDEAHGVTLEQPLGLSAYRVEPEGELAMIPHAYFQPVGVGEPLPDMPLFITPRHYVNVPLEQTYMAAWKGVPQRWKRVIEATDAPALNSTTDNGPRTTDNA